MRKKTLLILAVALALCVFACGCGDKGKVADENTLVYASQDYTSINPALYEHGEINLLIFAGMTAHNEAGEVVPGLAEKWDWNEKTLTYTFNLRKGLTFQDGEPLTSADVEFTINSILDKNNQSEIVSNFTDIEKITCPDENTVKIKLKNPSIGFPDYMSIGILPKHLLEGKDLTTADFNQMPVGAGPYKVTNWDKGQSITLEKFDGYYDGAPKIGKIIFKIVPDMDARALQLESGDVDMAQITPKSAANLKSNDNYNIFNMQTADYRAIAYNFNKEFFQKHKELPTILSYGIDRDAIVKSVLLGEGTPAYSPLQKNIYNNDSINKFDYDPEKCKKLLEEAGWKVGKNGYYEKDGDQLAFTIDAMENEEVRVDMANMCAQQLQKIGANVTAQVKPELDWENQDSCIIGWGSPFDADEHTYKVFATDSSDNYTYYSNKKIDKLLEEARMTEDNDKRAKLYSDFQEEMTKDMPYTFIAYIDADYAVNKRISGIAKDTVLGHHGVGIFWNVSKWEIK